MQVISALMPYLVFGAVLVYGLYRIEKKEQQAEQEEYSSMVDDLRRHEESKLRCDGQHLQCDTCSTMRRVRMRECAAQGRPMAGPAEVAVAMGQRAAEARFAEAMAATGKTLEQLEWEAYQAHINR